MITRAGSRAPSAPPGTGSPIASYARRINRIADGYERSKVRRRTSGPTERTMGGNREEHREHVTDQGRGGRGVSYFHRVCGVGPPQPLIEVIDDRGAAFASRHIANVQRRKADKVKRKRLNLCLKALGPPMSPEERRRRLVSQSMEKTRLRRGHAARGFSGDPETSAAEAAQVAAEPECQV